MKKLRFTPITKLLIIIYTGSMVIAELSFMQEVFIALVLAFLFVNEGRILSAVKFLAAFILMLYLGHMNTTSPLAQNFILPLAYMVRRFMLPLVASNYMINSTPIGVLMSSLEKLKLPDAFIIPLAVMIRFFPTLKEEYGHIRNAMKMRGIGISFLSIITKPLLSIEYILVPLLTSMSSLGDELAAAAQTKGVGSKGEKVRYHDVTFSTSDVAVLLLIAIMTATVLVPTHYLGTC